MIILGIHGGYTLHQHDAAASLMIEGKLICSVEEERLVRKKHSWGLLPIESIKACLKEANIKMQDVDLVAIPGITYKDNLNRTNEWLKHYWGYAPKIKFVHHQIAHISSAFYQSGFDDAMCISYDAFGDRLSGAGGTANLKEGIKLVEERSYENSIGVFYKIMTSFLGFKDMDEYKVMGLAAYGNPKIDLSFICKPTEDGYFSDPSYFRERKDASGLERHFSQKLIEKLGDPRLNSEPISRYHMDLAASTQQTLERCAISLITHLHKVTKKRKLCIAGGVGLNCSLNGVLSKLSFIDDLFIQPAASDRGLSLGCAFYAAAINGEKIQKPNHVFYGPSYDLRKIEDQIKITGVKYNTVSDPESDAAELLSRGKIIAWHRGRSEYGPRTLGHRSILADPGVKDMKDQINKKVKFREEFRPFAPSVLEEEYKDVYDLKSPSPFMTIACGVKDSWRKKLPATTHVNNTSRVQTVSKEVDSSYHSLIKKFYKITGRPAVLNTSFNIRGQPIVETPLEAISTFAGNGIDVLFIENFKITK